MIDPRGESVTPVDSHSDDDILADMTEPKSSAQINREIEYALEVSEIESRRESLERRRAGHIRDLENFIHRDPVKRQRWLDRVESDRLRALSSEMAPRRRRGWLARKLFGA